MSAAEIVNIKPVETEPRRPFDIEDVRRDFPILSRRVHDKRLIYFDNAASTQKPSMVIDRVREVYEHEYSNIHRGVHELSAKLTSAYEEAREKIRVLLNAERQSEVILTSGTTDAINLVMQTWGRANIGACDEIVITEMEHHSNIVPWQMIAEERGAKLRVAPVNDVGVLELAKLDELINPRTKLVALTHVSNTLGTINPIDQIAEKAHAVGAKVLVDGAQAVAHMRVDVRALNVDFYAFSAHKLFGPTGVGVLYGKQELLEAMPPWRGGGDMIDTVTFEKTTYAPPPHKFEAGTPNIAGVIGLGAAIDYVTDIGLSHINHYENTVLAHAMGELRKIDRVRLIGEASCKAAVVSFVVDGIHANDIGTFLDMDGVAVRTGHHCTQPLMKRFGVPATARASFAFYNTKDEVDRFVESLRKSIRLFG